MSAKGHIKGVNAMFDNLTKSDIEKMQEEIEYRKLVVRKEALEAVKEARAHGDLSENLNTKQQSRIRTAMKAVSVIWKR